MKKTFFNKLSICLTLFLVLNSFSLSFVKAEEQQIINISAPSALLMDYSSGKILYEKNIYEKKYPASLTKILTAIVVLENCDLSEIVTVSYDAVMSISFGYVTANLQVGEELTVEQLLYVLMVGSSNDAAIVLAEHVSGSVEDFSNLMNAKAKELGCKYSNFINPNGAHDENHYSTAYDLALIARYAMKNETFRTLVSTTYYKLPTTNKYSKDDRIFSTTNSLIRIYSDYYYKYATGIKTGFTTPAGNCLIASAKKDNLELITVILDDAQDSQRYLDTISLFEYGFQNYKLQEIVKSGRTIQTISISNATRNTKKLDTIVENDIYALMNKNTDSSAILPKVNMNSNLKAPLKKGDIVGYVTYTVEGIDYKENLVASNDVEKSKGFIIFIIIVFVLALCFIYIKAKKLIKRLKTKHR